MNEKTPWQARRDAAVKAIAAYQQELEALDRVGDIPGIGTVYVYGFMNEIEIAPAGEVSARDLALQIVSRMRDIGQPPTMATKTLNSSTGKITYTVPGPLQEWTIKVSGGDPRCKVKRVVTTREVPVFEKVQSGTALEEVVSFEIENPEECGASS